MNIILLSGGSGKRLWPLSNDVRSKQFIKLFKNNDEYESMVQRVYRQITSVDPDAKITIATSKSQASAIKNQLGDNVGISIEPCRRDTFPAIALAAAYLHDELGVGEDEAVVVCPVDPYVDNTYYEAVEQLQKLAEEGNANLTLMGIEPTYPSEKYGYIMPISGEKVSKVKEFKEKPNRETAEKYIKENALWNAGIFAFKLSYLLIKAHSLIDFTDYRDLFNKYDGLKKISFDYAVVEKEESIQVLRYSGDWKDVGTWNMMAEVMLNVGKKFDTLRVVNDQIGTPTYTFDLARLLVDMVESDKYGYYHATNEGGYISWYDFACEIFKQAGYDTKVLPVTTAEYGISKAKRPFNSRLAKHTPKEVLFKRCKQLLPPYIFTCFCILALSILKNLIGIVIGIKSINNLVLDIVKWIYASLYGAGSNHNYPFLIIPIGAIWFLLAMIFGSYIVKVIETKKNPLLWLIIVGSLGYFSSKIIWLPWSIQSAMTASVFIYMGVLIKRYCLIEKYYSVAFPLSLVFLINEIIKGNPCIGIVSNQYPNGAFDFIGGGGGALFVIIVVKYLCENINHQIFLNLLKWFGKNSLTILCMHLIELNMMPWHALLKLFGGINYFFIPVFILKLLWSVGCTVIINSTNLKNVFNKL